MSGRASGSATRSIQRAVGEIDLRIEDTLTCLRRQSRDTSSDGDLRDAVVRVARDLEPALAARGIELELAALPDAPIVGDESLARRVLCRLLLGACRWMDTQAGAVRVAIEAGVRFGWDRWLFGERGKREKSGFIGMHGFGASAPAGDLYKHFGITAAATAAKVKDLIEGRWQPSTDT